MTDEAFADLVTRVEARVGLTIKSKWRIDSLLGVGGMASVYAATHRNNKRVAVKMLHPELSMNAAIRQRFLREGYVANSVGHAGAVSVDDDDVADDGCAFLVMELLEGETLDARWERKGRRMDATEVLAMMDPVLDTLAAAHDKGIVHRDLKPENLFLTHSGQVKILDFGIARVRELSASGSGTQTGSLMGTPTFMPPEQARGEWSDVDGRSDLWAVGATMFTLLTGRYVHISRTVNEALVLAVTQPAPSAGAVGVALPREVVELVDRALAYDKSERWPDARDMQEALRHAYATLTNKPISLLEAVEADAPPDSVSHGTRALSAPKTPTTAGGVTATMHHTNAARTLVRRVLPLIALVAIVALAAVVAIASRSRGHATTAERLVEPSAAHSTGGVPTTAVSTSVANVGAVVSPSVERTEGTPVIPLDQLPLVPPAVPKAALDTQKTREGTRPILPPATPVGAGPIPTPQPAAPAADPFAARR